MQQAKLYSKYNGLQKHDAKYVAENYLRLVKWKSELDTILDVGCGDGDVIFEILLPRFPKGFGKLIGVDVSASMIKFARERFKNEKILFEKFDISSEIIPIEYKDGFDHIFSFYCLHWVTNQRVALNNIFTMLKNNGDILLTFLAKNPIFEIYKELAKDKKWITYMKDFEEYVSPYQNSEKPEAELEKLLAEIGFNVHLCRVERRNYTFPSINILRKSVAAVSPFIGRLPETEINNYIEDFVQEARRNNSVRIETCSNNNEEKIHCTYDLFIVYASKQH